MSWSEFVEFDKYDQEVSDPIGKSEEFYRMSFEK